MSIDPRTLAAAILHLLPGDLTEALEQSTDEERVAVESLLRRALVVRECRAMESPVAQLLRRRAAGGDGG